jgi:hypothetical protein
MDFEDTQSSYADDQEVASDLKNKEEFDTGSVSESKEIQEKLERSMLTESTEEQKIELSSTLHNEVLEKLGIVKKQEQDIQENPERAKQEDYLNKPNDLQSSQVKNEIEKAISENFDKIQKMVKSGLINSVQGQNLKKQVLRKAFDKLVETEKIKRASQPALTLSGTQNKNEVFEAYNQNNPNFFDSDGRKEVLSYLKSDNIALGNDELNKISDIIRTVEKTAIERYLNKVSHEKTLRDSNEIAKQKLTANAQKSSFGDKNLLRSFTREQIGKMSSSEFTKYEPYIMEQLKKGLIK